MMFTRRTVLGIPVAAAVGAIASVPAQHKNTMNFTGKETFDRLLHSAKLGGWGELSIGDIIGHVGLALVGTPYAAHTLELNPDSEACTVNLLGLDCVTFFESCLGFARMLLLGQHTPEALVKQVTFTRYRGGVVSDYTSRLHYTTDWFFDNARKGTVKIVTDSLPGAEVFHQRVGFMSAHPESYVQLKHHPKLVPAIRAMEARVNRRHSMFLPMDAIPAAEPLILTGDIIGVCTTNPGIDIAHTGLAYRDAEGLLHFLDASSAKSKYQVTLEGRLSEAVRWSDANTGIIVARPLPPTESRSVASHH